MPSIAPDARIPLEALTGDVLPSDLAGWSEAQRATRRELQARIDAASVGTDYDPRHVLTLPPARLAVWRERRRAWLRALVADDPHVGGATTWPR